MAPLRPQTAITTAGAKTMTIDPKTKNLYLAVADRGPVPAPSAEVPKPKGPVISGTFRVLELVP
jgi:hypothetical protein